MHGPAPSDLGRRFLRLTVLNALANLSVPLAGLADAGMLGHLPDIRFLGGVALASVLFDFVYWTFGFLRMGTTGTAAQARGRDDRPELYRVLYRSLLLAGGLAAAILALQVPLREAGFALLQGEPGVEAAGRAYFGARIWAAPATLANFAFLGWFLGREESGRALVLTVTANAANILFNYWLILRLGWNAYGAGLGTTLSQYLALAVSLALFVRSGRPERWRWSEVTAREPFGALLRFNRDILIRTVFLVSTFAIFTSASASLGTAVLAANTLLFRLFTLVSYLVDGVAYATESLAGVFRGAGDRRSLARITRMAMTVGMAIPVPLLAAMVLVPERVLGLLTDHPEVVALGARLGLWLVPVLLFGAAAFVYDGLFLGLTEGRALRNAMVVAMLAGFLPLAAWGVRSENVHLLWAALAAFMAARIVTLEVARRRVLEVR